MDTHPNVTCNKDKSEKNVIHVTFMKGQEHHWFLVLQQREEKFSEMSIWNPYFVQICSYLYRCTVILINYFY